MACSALLQLLLSQHDLELGGHLQQLGVPLLQQLWQQLSGALSDVLPSQADWEVLWDHCLAAAAGPAFLYQLLASYLITLRQPLLAVQDEQQLQRLLDSRPPMDMQKVRMRWLGVLLCCLLLSRTDGHLAHTEC
jgi:hypothetical protein